MRISLVDRFWSKVDVRGSSDCWNWTAATTVGYGVIRNGRAILYAHRVSWVFHNGLIPTGMNCLHRCDNRRCVNPGHLYLGTQLDNMQDYSRRGNTIKNTMRKLFPGWRVGKRQSG